MAVLDELIDAVMVGEILGDLDILALKVLVFDIGGVLEL